MRLYCTSHYDVVVRHIVRGARCGTRHHITCPSLSDLPTLLLWNSPSGASPIISRAGGGRRGGGIAGPFTIRLIDMEAGQQRSRLVQGSLHALRGSPRGASCYDGGVRHVVDR